MAEIDTRGRDTQQNGNPLQRYCLGKAQRLLTPADFQYVFDDAQFKASAREVLLLARPNRRDHPRLGLVIAKKNVRLAVQRNRIKRIIRETFRQQQHELGAVDVIVLARRGLDRLDQPALHQTLERCWAQLRKRVAKAAGQPPP